MRLKTLVYGGFFSGCVGLLCLCGKDKKEEIIIGSDSLSLKKLRTMMSPDLPGNDSAKIRQTLFRYSLARTFSKPAKEVDSASIKLARRMTLQSGGEWSPEAASLLLTAVKALKTKIGATKDIKAVSSFVDSVFGAMGPCSPSGKSKNGIAGLDTIDINDANAFNRIVSAVLGVSAEEALTVSSFVRNEGTTDTPGADVNKMVQGILSKDTVAPGQAGKKAKAPELAREKTENALLALKFRTHESIQDSIAKHLPDLQQIYKRQLKLNEMAGGVVWVVFQVGVEGSVLSAKIKSSDITNKQFQQLLEEYVRTIHFKAIPENVGPMLFEFPFEFKAEG
jgi:TonB family protein